MSDENRAVTLSLISHTNVGKTTLARTLLRRDIGEVRDQAHITDLNEAHVMQKTEDGLVLNLWDTPGFGDSARLLKRLQSIPKPTGWFLNEVWDRFNDRALWCSQQAMRNVREDADVVLYLVNSSEDPLEARYVEMEMQILDWLTKPVIVLLNQTGPPRQSDVEAGEERAWEEHLQRFEVVKYVMSLDAFARCWVQEDQLLKTIEGTLPFAKRKPFKKLWRAWRENNFQIFNESMDSLARQLAAAGCDRENLSKQSVLEQVQSHLPIPGFSKDVKAEKEAAMKKLAERLDANLQKSLYELIQLHSLDGEAAREIMKRMASHYSSNEPVNEGISAIVGGFFTGALGGVGADFLSGGLTFGGGAVVGGIMGALGAGGLARGFNLIRGDRTPFVRWSFPLFQELTQAALLRYLAVAHFGRGRGEYTRGEYPAFWNAEVKRVVEMHQPALKAIWEKGKRESDPSRLHPPLSKEVTSMVRELLDQFYPDAKPFESV